MIRRRRVAVGTLFLLLAVVTWSVALSPVEQTSVEWDGVRSDASGVQAQLRVQSFEIASDDLGDYIDIPGAYATDSPIPLATTMINVPNGVGIEASVTASDFVSTGIYAPELAGQMEHVIVGEPVVFRGIRLFPVSVSAARVADDGEIFIANVSELNVEYTGEDDRAEGLLEEIRLTAEVERYVRNLVLNIDEININVVAPVGRLLVVIENNATLLARMEPYVQWKREQGYKVVVDHPTSTTSYSAIYSLINSHYTNGDALPLDYVLLVGDHNGSVDMVAYDALTDHYYSQLEGNDILGDLAIGRFSVQDGNIELGRVVNKLLAYERDVDISDPSWLSNVVLTAGSGSGTSTIITNRSIKEMFSQNGVTSDTLWWTMGGDIPQFIVDKVNEGAHFVNFRGYYGFAGWSASDLANMNNGTHLPVIITITCGTGDFATTTEEYTEGFFRAGSGYNDFWGGIASVGTATISTHTRFNNIVDSGLFEAMTLRNIRSLGWALVNGKLRLYQAYVNTGDNSYIDDFSYWNNLIGDPALRVWVGVPDEVNVTHDASISFGQNYVDVTVDHPGEWPELIWATLADDEQVIATHRIDASGVVRLSFDPADVSTSMKLTVVGDNVVPYQADIPINDVAQYVYVASHVVNDGAGDDDLANPGETVYLTLTMRNGGTQTVGSQTATVTTDSPYLSIVGGNTFNVPSLTSGSQTTISNAVQVAVDPFTPDGALPELTVTLGANQTSDVRLDIAGFTTSVGVNELSYGGNGQLDPNESTTLVYPFTNVGSTTASGLTGTLTTANDQVTIVDGTANYPSASPGATVSNNTDPFSVTISSDAWMGEPILFTLTITDDDGGMDSTVYRAWVGDPANNGLTGPDEYGYWAVDNMDGGFGSIPIYNWTDIGITANRLNIDDTANEDDDALVVNLPFGFVYYGEVFNELTVTSNGIAAFGAYPTLYTFRNWGIPSPLGPPAMLSPNWDDQMTTGGGVYAYHDISAGRYIVQWDVISRYNSQPQSFQMVLFDPGLWPTHTGNGMIQFQYDTFSQEPGYSYDNDYCTVGIESPDQGDGVQYLYWTNYSDNASPITSGSAILFTDDLSGGGTSNPEAVIGPSSFNIPWQGTPVTEQVSIENQGDGTLVWSITEVGNEFSGAARRRELGLPDVPPVTNQTQELVDLKTYRRDKAEEYQREQEREDVSEFEGTGGPVIDDFGGPDLFGYSWIDSDEPDGPDYAWHAQYGTAVNQSEFSDYDDGYSNAKSLGFSFEFYGVQYNNIYINTNGFVTFQGGQTGSGTYSNEALPSTDAPRDGSPCTMLAGFWDDLNPEDGGTIYFYTNNSDLAVITWYDVPGYGNSGLYRFQIMLYGDGTVVYQYNNMGTQDITSATIGIQNASGSIGLTTVHNSTYVGNNLAVKYYTATRWFNALNTMGLLGAGESTTADIEFDGSDLPDGVYTGSLIVATNDVDNPSVEIPVEMYVGIQPPVVDDIPNQSIDPGQNFTTINLDNYVDDPNYPDNQISWAATGQSELTVSIVNRVATITPPSPAWVGSETVTFTATNPMNASDSDDATFTVGAGYISVDLTGGRYELVSFPVTPPSLAVEDVFDSINNLVVVFNDDGDNYQPSGSNTIGTIDVSEGYRVFTNTTQTFAFNGSPLDLNADYTVTGNQWNWIGHPFVEEMSITTAMGDITNHINIVIDDEGEIYWPQLGINTIGNLIPGNGYQMWTEQTTTFNYTTTVAPPRGLAADQNQLITELPAGPVVVEPTGTPYLVHVSLHEDLRDKDVDVIEVLDGSQVVGSGRLIADRDEAVIVTWQGDADRDVAGYTAGSSLKLRVLDESGATLETKIVGDKSFFGDGSHADIVVASAALPDHFEVSAGYPNPFNPTIQVPFALPDAGKVTFSVYNVLGQQVFAESRKLDAGRHTYLYRPENGVASGVYFLQVQYGANLNRQKIVLMK
ncbi:T9SS type A sorting domain-containing protein [bacterium]|nr:T9SS type A sorting domain-containing protein [bacterium]